MFHVSVVKYCKVIILGILETWSGSNTVSKSQLKKSLPLPSFLRSEMDVKTIDLCLEPFHVSDIHLLIHSKHPNVFLY